MVAFLERDAEASEWSTVSLSYGTLYPRGEEMEDMESMVRRAVELQGSDLSTKKLKRAKLEWLVHAAALPGTRWHGLYELEPKGDPIRSSYDRKPKARKPRLSEQQYALLAEAFLAHPKADYTSAMMLRVLRGYPDPSIDRLGLGMVEAALELDPIPGWLQGLMQEVLLRHGDPDPQARFDAVNEYSWEITPNQLWQLWVDAKEQLVLEEVAPVELEIPEYVPVGGRTPS